jgi:hypothetical protein
MDDLPAARVYTGTDDGLFVFDIDSDGVEQVGRSLAGETVRSVSVHPDDSAIAAIACGLRGWGLHRTTTAGRSTRLLEFGESPVWDVSRDPADPEMLYVGTGPPGLYRGRAGQEFESLSDFEDLPSRDSWGDDDGSSAAGHLHGISVADGVLVAAVRHGAVVYSHDRGETWVDTLSGTDAHDTAIVDGRILATTGPEGTSTGGLYRSRDGREWTLVRRFEGMYVQEFAQSVDGRLYVNAMSDPEESGVGIWTSDDAGETWYSVGAVPPASLVGCRLLDVHPADATVVFHATHHGTGSRLVVSVDGGATWSEVGPTVPTVRAVTVASR